MCVGKSWRRALVGGGGVVLALIALAAVAHAQGAQGVLAGTVLDEKGKPVEKAKVTITSVSDPSSKWETTTNAKGEYLKAIGYPGMYTILCEKEKVGSAMGKASVRIGQHTKADIRLITGMLAPEQATAQSKVVKQLFNDGMAASQAGNHQLAISKYNDIIAKTPNCSNCYYNIGVAQSQLKSWDEAEAAFKKAIEQRADYYEAYNGLAGVYSAQGKKDESNAAAAKAAELSVAAAASGGGSAQELYTQGTILWNASKIPEATTQFEQAVKADPNYAPAHFQYGMGLLNQGKVPEALAEFDAYMKLAPSGEYAAQAKAMIGQLRP
jgi:tetratricopeptide (TPR) repeat protein